MTIKQNGGIFGRNPEFNDVSVTDEITILENGVDVGGVRSLSGQAQLSGTTTGITFGLQSVVPTNGGSAIQNGTRDIGNGSNFWRNVYVSTGVYFGSQTTATHLDDYEEGTWTPTGTNVSPSSAGYYTKMGRMVHVSAIVTSTSGGTASGFGGLPYACVNNNSARQGGTVGYNSIDSNHYGVMAVAGGTTFDFWSGTGNITFSASNSVYMHLTYITT